MQNKKKLKSTCCYCGVGCGVELEQLPNNKINLEGDKAHPVNKGMLCSKGMNLHYTANDTSDRLLSPQIRLNRSMPLSDVSWDVALDRVSAVFKSIINRYGPESVAFYVSGQCLTEEYYIWNKLMKGFIGSNNIDTNSRLCMSSAVVGYKKALGEDIVPVSYDDIELSDCILVEGGNPAWCHPIIWRRVEKHRQENPDLKIIVVDPRKTATVLSGDLHIKLNPGTDVYFNNAIAHWLIKNGYADLDFIKEHTEDFNLLKEKVMSTTLVDYAKLCDIDIKDIECAAKWIGEAKGFISMWTMGLNQSVIGVAKNLSLINLSLLTGKIGKPGNGPFSLTGQPNAMGGREVGGLSNMLASHRELGNASHVAEMEDFWGVPKISNKPGLSATEMVDALESGELKAIWVICTNPLVSLPNSKKVEKAFKNAKFVVVQDISKNADTIKYADAVLPAATWAEKEGTMTNAERRISYLNKAIEPPGNAMPDLDIAIKFAHKMGWGNHFNYDSASDVYDEYAKSTIGTNIDCSGVNYDLLKAKTVQWPYPETNNFISSNQRIFEDKVFYTPSRKAKFFALEGENLSEKVDESFPFVLLTGRIRDQWHTQTKTSKVNRLNQHIGNPYIEINPLDAKSKGIVEGSLVVVSGRRGTARIKAKLTDDIKLGTCFMPMHWGKIFKSDLGRANNLTNDLVDPVSKEPDYKYAAINIQLYKKPKEKIIVIGAGSAGLGFIYAYRKLNLLDDIEVFSKEVYPFYNRVMLPDYISGSKRWDDLVKLRDNQFAENRIKVNKGVSIVKIDKENKMVTDSEGATHFYDRLILGMGSQAFVPPSFPKMKGIFSMRSRIDADGLKPFIEKQERVVVIGGGLLGLEMAASLQEIGLKVSVVQRDGRLMSRQLDSLGSSILYDEIESRGMDTYFNDEVVKFYGEKSIEKVKLKSGQEIECCMVIVATGTKPSIGLAKEANLDYGKGVKVNDYLQTSDSSIFACGEIAEWKGNMWGITAAAEQQARIAANYINGDITAIYRGSLSLNILKMDGFDLSSIGEIEIPKNAIGYEEVLFIDKSKRYYKKCLIENDKLVGAILIGDKSEFLEFKELVEKGIELSEKRLELLRSGQKTEPVIGELVCSCYNVGEGNIKNKIQEGFVTLDKLCEATGAGTGCGSCRPELRAILTKVARENEILTMN